MYGRDEVMAAPGYDGMPLEKLETFLNEIDSQPTWRDEAQRAAAYYDGKQIDTDLMRIYRERGQAPLVFNLIAPSIDGVLGIQAKTRSNWIVRADDNDSLEMAEGLNEKLNEEARLCNADKADADAYAAQAKTGLGWVEVNRNPNPLRENYRACYVHRNEIWWDWHAKQADLSDCRYLVRERWADEDRANLAFPKHKDLIGYAVRGWSTWQQGILGTDVRDEYMVQLEHAYSQSQETTLDDNTWWDSNRRRVRIFEVWYRTYEAATILEFPDGRKIVYDEKNAVHRYSAAKGLATVVVGVITKMRLAYFLGCHRIVDIESPLPHDGFPYTPYWGFREDGTGIPYGLVRRMMSPQDEVNARRAKMMWLLSAKRIIMDSDATLMDVDDLANEIQRPDAIIKLNPGRMKRDEWSFRIEQDFQLAAQQFEIMLEAQKMIQECGGIYSAMLGKSESDTQSGVAIASLVEQGSTTLAELNDNYRFARRQVGEQLLAFIVADNKGKQFKVATNVGKPQPTKVIEFNSPDTDENGQPYLSNDLTRVKARVVLDDIQATAGYRAQVANRLFDLLSTFPDELKAPLLDIVVEATDIPQRDEIVRRIRSVTGVNVDPESMSEDEKAEYDARKQAQAEQQQLVMDELRAKVEDLRAKAAKSRAGAGKDEAAAGGQKFTDRKVDAETDMILLQMQQLTQEMSAMREQMNDQLEMSSAQLGAYEKLMPDLLKLKAVDAAGGTKKKPPTKKAA